MGLHRDLEGVRGLAFDLDGTLYQDGRALPGAVDTVAAVRDAGLAVRFLTNTTSRSRRAVAARLRTLGFAADDADVLSPPAAAGAFLRAQRASAHLLVQPGALEDFEGVRIDDEAPDRVVVGDLGDAWSAARLNRAFRLVKERGARLLGLGRTRYWQAPDGLCLDAGAYLAALEYATGTEAEVFGKPDPRFFAAIVDGITAEVGGDASTVAVVGDDLRTDVQAGMRAGMRGVLVRTGKFREDDLERAADGGPIPDVVLGSVAEIWSVPA